MLPIMPGIVNEVQLMPQRVSVTKQQGLFSRTMPVRQEAHIETVPADAIAWATAALRELLAQNPRPARLKVIFSDTWVRYDLLSLGDNELSDADALALAQAQFVSLYPAAADWSLRVAKQGDQLLVAGVNPFLVDAINQVANDTGCRLAVLEPWFAHVMDHYEKELAKTSGWVLFDEPGMLIVAMLNQGVLSSLHCHHCAEDQRDSTAQLLLNRQSALLGYSPGEVSVFSFSGNHISLQAPWRVRLPHAVLANPGNQSSGMQCHV